MSLSVLVKSASHLPDVERFTKSDPFTVVTLQGQKRKTHIVNNSLNPVWDKTLTWELSGGIEASELLTVEVYNHEIFGNNRILGSASVLLREVVYNGRMNVSQTLTGKHGEMLTAKIILELMYQAQPGSSKRVEGGKDDESGIIQSAESNQQRGSHKERDGWRQELSNKPTDFQVRVHVLEARKLVGSNPNPTVKVACGKHIQQTSTQKGTNNPAFDEVLSFNFRDVPSQMFNHIIEVKVFNAKKIISDALIGSFKFDLGLVYREEDHCFIHKWLLLTDPRYPSGGVKGYLKLSIQVLGPGDDPKHSPSLTEVHHDTVDIESNLLRPSGVRLAPATLMVRIFHGEDIPQMDPSYFEAVKKFLHVGTVQKELVDPYCTVSFAGHMESTQVIWHEQNPRWNKQINLGVRFPSMCEKIRLQIKDKDNLNNDDTIGTCYLNNTKISADGNKGFLPTFGPCFVNCYGSPREYSDLPDKYDYLNKGLIEGVAYRGRVMVEVGMTLGQSPKINTVDISTSDLDRLTPFLRQRKYKLFGAFFSANMVYPGNHPVQFEVSIGNYGNKQDDNFPAQLSTTPPSNPLYDGSKYYYLPWRREKPVVEIDSQWEDCSYRINSLNLILFTAESLKKDLDSVKKAMAVEVYSTDAIKDQLNTVLESLSENLHQPLPELPEQGFTQLDMLTREHRMKEWRDLYASCNSLRRTLAIHPLLESVAKLEEYIGRLENMAHEPQNSVPDVIIWMLSNNKRVAVKRIPSHELMYSAVGKCRGKDCGKLQTIYLTPPAVEKEEELKELQHRAQVKLLLWLGLDRDQQNWTECCAGGEVTVYAETYENEVKLFGIWDTTRLLKPHWSDASGNIKQPREAFDPPPPGWRWEGEWEVQPVQGMDVEADDGLHEYTEEVFENQTRDRLSNWSNKSAHFWTDIHGTTLVKYERKEERKISLDEIEPPQGWVFKEDWKVDMNRAVDEEGWEYTVEAGLNIPYVPFERNIHLSRRRRWIRIRIRDHDSKAVEKRKQKHDMAIKEGWEYAPLGSNSFHLTEGLFDFARRRRYVRRLINETPGARAVFRFTEKKDKSSEDEEKKQQVPCVHLEFKEHHTYQLRTYLYQARSMYSSDKTGQSDPYAIVSFDSYSSRSRIVKDSLSPMWDQTMISGQIKIFGDTQSVLESPLPTVLEFYDKDRLGKDEFLGSSVAIPTIRLTLDTPAPKLHWTEIIRYNKPAGEVLAAFELLLDDGDAELPPIPAKASLPLTHYLVPDYIRPVLQKTRIEVLCWGVRDMKHYLLLPVDSPLVEIECGGVIQRSRHIEDTRKNPNFPDPLIHFEVYLPNDKLYCPPLTIRVLDKRTFGFLPVIGTHVVKSVNDFLVAPVMSAEQSAAFDAATEAVSHKERETKVEKATALSDPDSREKSDFDWWSKYYYSIGDARKAQKSYVDQGYDGMAVYDGELEEAFNGFTDLVQTLPLYRNKTDPEERSEQPVGFFKGSFKAYPVPEDDAASMPELIFSNIPSTANDPVEVIVRVYIIKGIDLQPRDLDGKSDPYIKIKIGNTTVIDDKDNYIPSDLNPIFGKMFEFPATLPLDHTLTISVMDWDRLSADDLIGETKIDLENRFLSQHRATCGLPESFSRRGPNKWRDRFLPKDILDDWIKAKVLPPAQWAPDGKSVTIGSEEYTLSHFEAGKHLHPDLSGETDQRLALHILRQQNLVPEHIETRNLYTAMHPGISQGQLHMWVDMFKKADGVPPPPPVDVSPRKPEKYVLRVVVWNTKDVQSADEVSLITGEAMSDIYVKGWLQGKDDTQKTDVHHRTLNGEGHFNWRFVFPLEYLSAENVMVVKKKEHFYSLTETEHNLLPVLTMQVWDNDTFTPDDFIGTVDFNLSAMPLPAKRAEHCSLAQLPQDGVTGVNTDNLFDRKRMKGWWPAYDMDQEGTQLLKGKLELEFEILTEESSKLHPAAKGRNDPNQHPKLDPPNRPVTSLLWFASPWKAFDFLVWRRYKKQVITILVVIFIIIIIAMFL